MGKSSLIIVLGMMGLVSFLVIKLNANSNQNVSTTVDMFNQTQSRLIANTGVEIYLEKLYADSNLVGKTSPPQYLFGGTYVATITGTLPNVRVTSTSTFQGVPHTSVADAQLQPVNFPNLPGGVYISANAVVQASEVGSMEISGLDHNTDGTLKGTGKPAIFGVGVDNEQQKLDILAGLKKPANVEGLIDTATGATGYPSVGVTSLGIDWAKIYQYIANSADQTFIDNIPISADLGSLADPKITLVNADASKTGSIMINGNQGAGIMVVNGDISFAGNFEYQGIILCYKNSDLTFKSTGTNRVIGGIIIAGEDINFKLAGNMTVLYSLDALMAVRANLKSDGFKILCWYE